MRVMERISVSGAFARRAWALAGPYWRSEERWRARAMLAIIVALTLALVVLNVLYNNWNRDFFEALQNKDFASFGPLLLRFGVLATLYIVAAVIRLYLTMMLQMGWRIWLTRRFLDTWLRNGIFYQLEHLADDLDAVENWANRLSVGEQQRLAVARALLQQPEWIFLDEATAALDEAAEQRMYQLLTERLPNATIVSIAHRPEVAPFHTTRYAVTSGRSASVEADTVRDGADILPPTRA